MIRGAVLGSPISHSLSPLLHNEAFLFLGIEGTYRAIEVPSGTLASFVKEQSESFEYFSLTMPLKEEVLSLGIETDTRTIEIQSANTLYKRDSLFQLTSTDGSGFLSALAYEGATSFNRVLILGAGGTARAVAGALDSISQEIHVLGRSSIREEAIRKAIHSSHFEYYRWTSDLNFEEYDLVVNTTPAGAADQLTDAIRNGISTTLFDVIYKPWPTELAKRWSDCGGKVINGIELLLYQGIDQLEIVLNQRFDKSELAHHLRPILTNAAV